jgi:uncharacterized protein (TIGR03382 family)
MTHRLTQRDARQLVDSFIDMHTQLYPSGEIRGQLFPVNAVPEPGVALLLAWGLLAVAWSARARRKRS